MPAHLGAGVIIVKRMAAGPIQECRSGWIELQITADDAAATTSMSKLVAEYLSERFFTACERTAEPIENALVSDLDDVIWKIILGHGAVFIPGL